MRNISIMTPKLANMIAAGEVVEKISSVIKELVENSIDAKASIIKIEVFELGIKKIKVTDNGEGIYKEDLDLVFKRHATSKIKTTSDLNHILSLGFRGEALAAISSVAKVLIESRKTNETGNYVYSEAGDIKDSGTAAINYGTSVEVSDLFYNTPARFKYLKSEYVERNNIITTFNELALSNPNIRLSLHLDNKLYKETVGNNDIKQLIDVIYGKNITKGLKNITKEIQKINFSIHLVSPEFSRSNRRDVHIMINNRYIKNYTLTQAVINGYHSRMMTNKYPIALIYLTIDPTLVDINVSPQKYEVKLVNEKMLAFLLEDIVKSTLLGASQPIVTPFKDVMKQETYSQDDLFEDIFIEENKVTEKIPDFDYIGNLASTYLMFQNKEGLYLMDQHAAEERIRYEYYMESFKNFKYAKKPLLITREIDLTTDDINKIKNFTNKYNELGFEFDSNFNLKTIPSWLLDDEIDKAILSILNMLEIKNEVDLFLLRDDLAKDISCKGAIKANKPLNLNEINALVSKLKNTNNPYSCPHGRPTIIKITHYEIERMFRRVV